MSSEIPNKIKEKIDNLIIEPEDGQTLDSKKLLRKLRQRRFKWKNKEHKIDCVTRLMQYCVEKYSVTFPERTTEPNSSKRSIRTEPKGPTKAGVVVITKNLELLLIHYYGELQLPKGKRNEADGSLKATGYRELREETSLELPYEEGDSYDNTIILKSRGKRVLFFVEMGVDCSKVDFTHTLDGEVHGVVLVPIDKLRYSSARVKVRNKSGKKYWRNLNVCAHIHDLIGQIREKFIQNEEKDDEISIGEWESTGEEIALQSLDIN